MKIHAETVDRIKDAVEITEVIGDYVNLKKRGANYQACCPFHNEKTPSFSVNPVRQIYKCFGCGASGDAIKFVMDIDGVGYMEALRHLAQKYKIEIREEEVSDEAVNRQNEKESLYIVLNFAKDFFQKQLTDGAEGRSIALPYFRERGLSDTTIEKFQLGYSPSDWSVFSDHAVQKGYTPQILESAGLSIKREGKDSLFDRFRERVIFPIHNISGKVIAFGGRILKTDKKAAKYINSPETAVYHKSDVLYGIHQARNAIRQADLCYLVEGYTDVLSLHQGGIENVVASSGTSLTIEQIRLINRFTPNITILYDGDAAGVKAALRGIDLVLEEGLNVSIVTFPDNDDPDSYMRKVGSAKFIEHIQQATQDFITFKTEALLADAGDDPFKKAELITDIVHSIAKIPDAIKRQVFFARVAERMKIEEQTLITEGNKLLRQQTSQRQKEKQKESTRRVNDALEGFGDEPPMDLFAPEGYTPPEKPEDFRKKTEEECIRLLVLYGNVELEEGITVCHYILEEIEDQVILDPVFGSILQVFKSQLSQGKIPHTDFFIRHENPEIKAAAINWTTPKFEVSNLWFDKHEIYVPTELDVLHKSSLHSIFRLMKQSLDEELKELLQKLSLDLDEATCQEVQARYLEVKKKSVLVSKELGIIFG
ncbi:DNA primase [Ravibacter arvi]|uniref:DNA primase n=1 Tax=Ravibacter arvi TaxID=2051041 RepID=A0ABP8LZ31_9BACT